MIYRCTSASLSLPGDKWSSRTHWPDIHLVSRLRICTFAERGRKWIDLEEISKKFTIFSFFFSFFVTLSWFYDTVDTINIQIDWLNWRKILKFILRKMMLRYFVFHTLSHEGRNTRVLLIKCNSDGKLQNRRIQNDLLVIVEHCDTMKFIFRRRYAILNDLLVIIGKCNYIKFTLLFPSLSLCFVSLYLDFMMLYSKFVLRRENKKNKYC